MSEKISAFGSNIILPLSNQRQRLSTKEVLASFKTSTHNSDITHPSRDVAIKIYNYKNEKTPSRMSLCGPTGTRTPNPLIANEVLYQLSHRPSYSGHAWTRTRDLVIISDAL